MDIRPTGVPEETGNSVRKKSDKNVFMNFSISDHERESLLGELRTANLRFQKIYPGDKPDRQPVHTVYGGANLFKSDTCIKMGAVAVKTVSYTHLTLPTSDLV